MLSIKDIGWLVVILTLYLFGNVQHISGKCLQDLPDIYPKRHFYLSGADLPIVVETSSRASHQLVSRVLRILLTEVLGYAKVELRGNFNRLQETEALERLASFESSKWWPETMVNLETWLKAGYNLEPWINNGPLLNAGPLGPLGRFGWFMSSSVVRHYWESSQLILDHWKSLRLSNNTSLFSLSDQSESLASLISQTPSGSATFCDEGSPRCHNGISTEECQHHRRSCALLLSSYQDLDNGILEQQIRNLGLHVKVAWIGASLDSFVYNRTMNSKPVLFFNWIPNFLPSSGDYSRVGFPECKATDELPLDCDFQVHQLTKMIWATLKTHTPEAYDLITKFTFTQNTYDELLHYYDSKSLPSDEKYELAACNWVKDKRDVWDSWILKYPTSKQQIYLGGMFPLTGPYWRQPGIVPGALMAVDYVNEDTNILADYELVLQIEDTQCKVDVAMKQFFQYMMNRTIRIAGILGPGCSETAEPIAGVSKHFNRVVISYGADTLQLANRAWYPFFFRTVPQISQNADVYLEMFAKFKWTQVALLAEDGEKYPEYHAMLKDRFLQNSIHVVYDRKMPRQSSYEEATKYVDELKKKEVKIIIVTSFEKTARSVMCDAYRKEMTAEQGYVWFLSSWFTNQWWNTSIFNKFGESVPCSSQEMQSAVLGYFALMYAFLGPSDLRIVGNITVAEWRRRYLSSMDRMGIESSSYASYAYDAVIVFALALDKLLKEDPSRLESINTTLTVGRFMDILNNTQFDGATGHVRFDGPDRPGIIEVHQYRGNISTLVGHFYPDRNASDRLKLDMNLLLWGDEPPSDGRPAPKRCGIEEFRRLLGVECDMAIIVANIIGISLFVLLMIILLLILKRRYDVKVRATRERMEELGLLVNNTNFSLDEWEIPRDHVVLNRKLGEGAFGTVYGGEAKIDGTWAAVAVKTLKIGSNAEEKLHFLVEADLMKRFDHENIVKLLGICTRGEPAYAVMEFMLHGDLKTFLLSRRHLVGLTGHQADDIQPNHLTKMALDVALGLQYLTELKYVHRDLACRNCLVHAEKTVKLGDFGLTRLMYDNDYYRFNKRGMFPVRWMAPESLADGIFTAMSDIWSYGVLLFEIITFGSFPYQGLSNREVLDYVKNGHALEPPHGCPYQMHSLLLQCWSYEPRQRPAVGFIVDLLKQNPNVVIPSLDEPNTAVALEGTGSLSMPFRPSVKAKNPFNQRHSIEQLHQKYSLEEDVRLNESRSSPAAFRARGSLDTTGGQRTSSLTEEIDHGVKEGHSRRNGFISGAHHSVPGRSMSIEDTLIAGDQHKQSLEHDAEPHFKTGRHNQLSLKKSGEPNQSSVTFMLPTET